MEIYNCLDVIIKDSSFKFSVAQSLALVNVFGQVTIDYCEFTQNTIYDDHGAAVYYSSFTNHKNVFTVNNCNFSNNSARSVVYVLERHKFKGCWYLHLNNLEFSDNQAVPLYVINHYVWINGNLHFQGNHAENGGGIFSDHAELRLANNSNVIFSSNTAIQGSAIYIINFTNITFEGRCMVMHNNASNTGTFYSIDYSTITFSNESIVDFINNQARVGGVFTLQGGSTFTCTDNCKAHFEGNTANIGGVIYSSNSNIRNIYRLVKCKL